MPDWNDAGLVLRVVKQSERNAVVTFFTQNNGRTSGLCKGAFSKTNTGVFETGNLLRIRKTARLEEHLGTVSADLVTAYAADVLNDADRLLLLSSACALLTMLPESEPDEALFTKTVSFLTVLPFDGFWEAYARWELFFLTAIGFGPDLSVCALTGRKDGLAYVSPKTGRAVCAEAAGVWKDRLLPIPAFLMTDDGLAGNADEIKKALALTGFFLENHAAKTLDCRIPFARKRLFERIMVKR